MDQLNILQSEESSPLFSPVQLRFGIVDADKGRVGIVKRQRQQVGPFAAAKLHEPVFFDRRARAAVPQGT